MHRSVPVLLVALSLAAAGCATVFRGGTDTVHVDADADSAYVFLDGVPAGVTPARIAVKRTSAHQVEVVRPGFIVERAALGRAFNPGAAALGFLGGGLTGILVDVSTGAVYDVDPNVLSVTLRPDSLGTDAPRVARMVEQARVAARTGFADADPERRRPEPWVTVQTGIGVFAGVTTDSESGSTEGTGGGAACLQVGARTQSYTAKVRAITSSGVLLNNSRRWEVAALVGLITETGGGRVRLEAAMGPGLSGGREDSVCFLCGLDDGRADGDVVPSRVGLAGDLSAFVYVVPQVGLGLNVPVNYRLGDTAGGVLLGLRFEGL